MVEDIRLEKIECEKWYIQKLIQMRLQSDAWEKHNKIWTPKPAW